MPALDLQSDAATDPSPTPSARRRTDPRVVVAVVATAVTVLPALVVLAKFSFRDVLLTGDFGIIAARVRDVWSGELPLLGPYSSAWNHPGPLYFWLLAPLNAIFGGAAWTIVAGGALLQVVAVVWSAWLAWRRGGLGLTLLVLAVFALSTLGASERLLLDPWNPHVALPFFVLLVLQLWSVMLRDRWQLVGAAAVGTFLVQTHVGYAPLVAAGVVVALAGVVLDARVAGDAWAPWSWPVFVSLGASLLLWLAPVWEQLTNDPGNFTLMARYMRDTPEGVIGFREGAGTFAALFRPIPVWLGGPERFVPLTFQPRPESSWWLLVPAALLLLAATVAWRRRLAAELRLVVLVGVLTAVGIVALGRVRSNAWTYMSLWRIPLAVLVVAVTVWTLWRAWRVRPPAARTVGVVVLGAAILGGSLPVAVEILDTRHVASLHDDVAAVVDQVEAQRPAGTVLVRNVGPALRGVAPTIVDQLDRAGVDVRVDPEGDKAWGEDRTATLDEVDEVWLVTEDGMRGTLLRAVPDARVIARTSPLPPREERELSRLQRELARQLAEEGRPDLVPWLDYVDFVPLVAERVPSLDAAKVARVDRLVRKVVASARCRCTVVVFAPDRLPGALAEP